MEILIDKIRIKNFRALKDVEVNLTPITILVGANNSGKTTLLRAINSVLGITRNQINQDDLFIDKNGNYTVDEKGTVNKSITIDVRIVPCTNEGTREDTFNNKWGQKLGSGIQPDGNREVFAFRTIFNFGIEDSPSTAYYLFSNWENEQLMAEDFKGINQIRNNIKMYFIDAQRDILEDSKQRTSFFGKLVSNLDYGDDLKELKDEIAKINEKAIEKSAVLKHLKDELKKLNHTTKTQGEGVTLNPFPKKISDLHKGMKVYFQDNESDSFSMENHGMGTRSWASMITAGAFSSWEVQQAIKRESEGGDLYFPLFALEEPEAHLHPNAQRTLYKQLKDFEGQKIVSTHSPYIAGQAELEELRHFYKENDNCIVSEIDSTILNSKEKIRIQENIQSSNGEVLFSNAVVMSEGKTESILLPIFAQAYFAKAPFILGVEFIATGKYYPLLTLLRFLKVKWFVFSDYDKPDVKSVLNDVLLKNEVIEHDNVIKLNDEISQKDIEEYLYDEGYEAELKEAIKKLKTPEYQNEQHRLAKQKELEDIYEKVNQYSKDEVLTEIRNWKVQAARIYVLEILKREDKTRIPPKIRELFDKIAVKLNLKSEADEQSNTI